MPGIRSKRQAVAPRGSQFLQLASDLKPLGSVHLSLSIFSDGQNGIFRRPFTNKTSVNRHALAKFRTGENLSANAGQPRSIFVHIEAKQAAWQNIDNSVT